MKTIIYSIIFSLFSSSSIALAIEDSNLNWTQMSNENNIVIFEGEISKDGVIPLKGTLIINSSIEKVAAILDDSSLRSSWLPAIQDLSVLSKSSPYKKVEFYQVEMPFIISDRTFIMESRASINSAKDEIFVTVKSVQDKRNLDSSNVRGNVQNSYIRIKKISNNQTLVEGAFYTDPKGYVPNWVVTRFTREFCRESLLKLKVLTEKKTISKSTLKRYANLMNSYREQNIVADSN